MASSIVIDAVRECVEFGSQHHIGFTVDREYSIAEQWERIVLTSSRGWKIVLLNAHKELTAVIYHHDQEIAYADHSNLRETLHFMTKLGILD